MDSSRLRVTGCVRWLARLWLVVITGAHSAFAQSSLYDWVATLQGPDGVLVNTTITNNGVSIPVEFIRYAGDRTYTASANLGSTTPDASMLMVRYEGNLTITNSATLTAAARKRGMVIYVKGNLSIPKGAISMTGRGAAGVPGNNLLVLVNQRSSTTYSIPAAGAAGGPGWYQYLATTANGRAAENGAVDSGRSGGGGGGGLRITANGSTSSYRQSGSGSAGTSYSGGSGGGGMVGHWNYAVTTAGSGGANGGSGGAGAVGPSASGAGGGAGNSGGSGSYTTTGTGAAGTAGTGGTLILFVDGIASTAPNGSWTSKGSNGGGATQYSTGGSAGGGGSGGGIIDVFSSGVSGNNYDVSGGSGGSAQASGAAGGAGSVRTVAYSPLVLSGRVTNSLTGAGVNGVSISYSYGTSPVITSNGGYYTIPLAAHLIGGITSSCSDGTISPSSISYGSITTDQTDQNFSWTPVVLTQPDIGSATNVTASSFCATWYTMPGATNFLLDVSTSASFSSFVAGYENRSAGFNLSHCLGGLASGTWYYYRIRAQAASDNISTNSATASVRLVPVAPAVAAASGLSFSQFTANWTAAFGATNYLLDASTDPAFSTYVSGYQSRSVGDTTSAVIAGLAEGVAYYYRVRAQNEGGISTNSASTSATTYTATPVLPGWKYRKKLTIESDVIDADLANFPVLVRLTAANFNFSQARSDGYDIRFVSTNGVTLFAYERERHDAGAGKAEYWVNLPVVSGAVDTEFYLYYGNPAATNGENAAGVWDRNVRARYAMGNATSLRINDSTTNNNGAAKASVDHPRATEGVAGWAQEFNGTSDYLEASHAASLNLTTAITIQTWVNKPGSWESAYQKIVGKCTNPSGEFSYGLSQGASPNGTYFFLSISGTLRSVAVNAYPSANAWHHLVGTYDGSTMKYYIDGALVASANYSGTITANTHPLRIGYTYTTEYFRGLIDDVRISDVARSPAWIKAEYYSGRDALVTHTTTEVIGYEISGRVTNRTTGVGVDGITLAGGGLSATTANGGYYNLGVSGGWSGTLTPSYASSGIFTPESRSYSVVSGDQLNQDYNWIAWSAFPPTTLVATQVLGTSFCANWTTAPGATNYLLDVSANNSFSTLVSGYDGRSVGSCTTYRVQGLTPGATFYYRLRTQASEQTSANSGSMAVTLGLANAPELIRQLARVDHLQVGWLFLAEATNYLVDVATDPNFNSCLPGYRDWASGNGPWDNHALVQGLLPGTVYYFRIRAVNGSASSDYSATLPVATAPLAPAIAAATNVTRTGFCVNWTASVGAVSYRLDVAISESFYVTPGYSYVLGYENRDVGNSQTYCLDGLWPGNTYFYRVRAVGPDAVSSNSQIMAVTLIPDPPPVYAATNITSRRFNANWERYIFAQTHLLDVARDAAFTDFVPGYSNRNVGAVGTAEVTDLSPCSTYYYRVRTQNAGGISSNSATITVTTDSVPPTSLAASNVTLTSFWANWSAVEDASSYQIDVSTSPSFSSYLPGYQALALGDVQTLLVSGLSAGQTYYYRVAAVLPCGRASAPSTARSVMTLPPAPAPRTTYVDGRRFGSSWPAVTGALDYRIDVSTDSGFGSYVSGQQNRSVGGSSVTVSGLQPNTLYYYRVRAENAGGSSTNSITVSVTTAPDAPETLAATNGAGTSFWANWTAAVGADGYRLDVSLSDTFGSYVSGGQDLDAGTALTRNVTGLQAGYTYYYRVRATGNGATSTNSGTMEVTTYPNPPTALAATSVSDSGFTANWVAQGIATNYQLDVATDSGFTSYVAGYQNLFVGTAASRAVSGLSPNATYYYRVRLQNKGGTSGNSETITVYTGPSIPTAQPATLVTPVGFTANWGVSAGSTAYRLDVSANAGFTSYVAGYQNLNVGNVLQRAVAGLTPGRAYYYRVRAVNSQGAESGNSGTITVTTDPVEVSISNLVVDAASGVGTVMWASVATVAYDVYQSDSPYRANMEWTKAVAVTAQAANASAPVSTTPARFYQLAVSSDSPAGSGVWGVIKPEAKVGFTLMSPPLRTDRRFDGKMGEELAASLNGDDGGAGDSQGDEVYLLQENGSWRTLYLDGQKVWRESDGSVSSYELPAGSGFFVLRNSPSNVRVTFTGPVGNDGTQTNRLVPGWNILGLSEGPVLPVKATFANAEPRGGSSEEEADMLVIPNADGSWRRLMLVTGWGAPYDGNWFDLRTFQIATNTLPPGAAYYYYRQPAGGSTEVTF